MLMKIFQSTAEFVLHKCYTVYMWHIEVLFYEHYEQHQIYKISLQQIPFSDICLKMILSLNLAAILLHLDVWIKVQILRNFVFVRYMAIHIRTLCNSLWGLITWKTQT